MFKIFRRLYKYIFKYKILFFIGVFFFGISSILENIFPILLKDITNIIENNNFELLPKLLITISIIKLSRVIIRSIAIQFSDETLFRVIKDIRNDVFEYLHKLDFAFHSNKASGSLISMFKRGQGGVFGLYDGINFFLLEIFFDFTFMIIIFSQLYPKMILIIVGTIVINTFFMIFGMNWNLKTRKKMNNLDDDISAVTVDNMIAFDTVKYFAQEEYEQKRLFDLTQLWKKAGINYAYTFRYIDIVNGGIITIGMLLMIIVSSIDTMNGTTSTGNFVLVSSFALMFFPKLFWFVFIIRDIVKNYADVEKYLNIFDEEIQIKENVNKKDSEEWQKQLYDGKPAQIEFKNLNFAYEDGKSVLNNIDLKIEEGESIAFVGKSGAGKTTMTKLLMRFYDPTQGDILLDGINIKNVTKEQLRKRIGIVPQEALMFNNTIRYNIAYGKDDATDEEIIEACKKANLWTFIDSLEKKLETQVGERGIKLSGGQRQRLAIARMILEDAPIIIFDEATSSLDSESEKLIQEAFWKAAENKTTIIIAHRLSTVKKADRIIVLDDGKIIEQGTHTELTNQDSGIYKYLWDLQTSGEMKE